jgi:hypothetical protein
MFKSITCTHLPIWKKYFHQLGKQKLLSLSMHGRGGGENILTTSKIPHGIGQLVTRAFYSIARLDLLIKVDNAIWRCVAEK